MNSLLISLIHSTYFTMTYNFFDFTNSFTSRAYTTLFYIPILTILGFLSGFLDILISVERLIDFLPHIRKLTSLKYCFVLMFAVAVITLPYFFIYYPAYIDVSLSQNETFRLYYVGPSEFGQSSAGKVVNNVLFFIKDIVAFVVEVVLNIILIVLLRKHIHNKKAMIHMTPNPISSPQSQGSSLSPIGISDSPAEITFRSNHSNPKALASKRSKSITVMVVVICVLSGFAHLTSIMCISLLTFSEITLSYHFCFGSSFFLSFKSFWNFFIFFLFNNLFCIEFKKLVGFKSE